MLKGYLECFHSSIVGGGFGLNPYDAGVLVSEKEIADYFEAALKSCPDTDLQKTAKLIANWIAGDNCHWQNLQREDRD